MSNLKIMKGHHGTCEQYSKIIQNNGFKLPSNQNSLLGRGIYFWKTSHYSKLLAIKWHQFKCSLSECNDSVITAKIRVGSNNYLDLTEKKIENKFIDLCYKMFPHEKINKEKKILLTENFINQMEEAKNSSVFVIEGRVKPPQGGTFPIEAVGTFPVCLVVRNVECINIEKVEVLP